MRKRYKNPAGHEADPQQEDTKLPGGRRMIRSNFFIDYDCFRKTPEEKQRLKTEKAREKNGIFIKKKCRPGKMQRERLKLKKK